MKYKKNGQDAGLFDYQERPEELQRRTTPLDKLNETVDWELFPPCSNDGWPIPTTPRAAAPPYDPVFMFKVAVL